MRGGCMGTATNLKEIVQRAKKEEQAEKEKSERKNNQQINFWLMRETWNKVRGRAKKDMVENRTIYETLKISRERFTRAVEGQGIRLSNTEVMALVKKTGMDAEIFDGTRCFQIEGIRKEDWEDLFELRDSSIKDFKKKGKILFNRIVQMKDRDRDVNLNNFVAYLISTRNSVPIEQAVKESVARLDRRTFDLLEDCSLETLEEYLRSLEAQVEKVDTLVKYKKFKK